MPRYIRRGTTFFPLVTKQFATIWAVGCSRRVFANVLARQTRTCMSRKALYNNKRRGQHGSPHTHSKDQQLATIGASLTVHFRLFWLHKAITGRTHTSAWAFYQSTTGKQTHCWPLLVLWCTLLTVSYSDTSFRLIKMYWCKQQLGTTSPEQQVPLAPVAVTLTHQT